ncbi:MAG: hypothetical protein BWY76_03139 [bacterium ADurb.Bin429]|nr:MAG: hypothetical protein BWY76_03139 [bacterium ADurb.Bin429]
MPAVNGRLEMGDFVLIPTLPRTPVFLIGGHVGEVIRRPEEEFEAVVAAVAHIGHLTRAAFQRAVGGEEGERFQQCDIPVIPRDREVALAFGQHLITQQHAGAHGMPVEAGVAGRPAEGCGALGLRRQFQRLSLNPPHGVQVMYQAGLHRHLNGFGTGVFHRHRTADRLAGLHPDLLRPYLHQTHLRQAGLRQQQQQSTKQHHSYYAHGRLPSGSIISG